MKAENKRTYLLIGVLILIALISTQFSVKKKLKKYSEARVLMGTVVRVDVCLDNREDDQTKDIYEKIWKRLEDISWRMNIFDEKSEVTKINQSTMFPVKISEDTYELLRNSFILSRRTKGAASDPRRSLPRGSSPTRCKKL